MRLKDNIHDTTSDCIQKMSISESDGAIASMVPSDYVFHHKPRVGRTGGGVGFLLHNHFQSYVIKLPDFEHLVLNCKFNNRSVNFVSDYR